MPKSFRGKLAKISDTLGISKLAEGMLSTYNMLAEFNDVEWASFHSAKDLTKRVGPEKINKILENGLLSYRGRQPETIIKIRDKFKTCAKNALASSSNDFGETTLGKALTTEYEAETESEQQTAKTIVVARINEALEGETAGKTEVQDVLASLDHLVTFLSNKHDKYWSPSLPYYVDELHKRGTEALNQRLEDEKKAITDLFEHAENSENFKLHINTLVNPAEDATKAQADLLSALEAKHKTAVEAFEKDIAELSAKVKQEVKEDDAELKFLTLLLTNNENQEQLTLLKTMCRRLAAEKDGQQLQGAVLEAQHEGKFHATQGILKYMAEQTNGVLNLKTKNGTPLTYNPNEKTVTLNPPSTSFYNINYWYGYNKALTEDLNDVAAAIKAQGHESIVLSINHQDLDLDVESSEERNKNSKSLRMKVARKAYDACLLQGFPPDKIKIKINGEEFSKDKLFSGYAASSKAANQRAAQWKEMREKIDEKYQKTDSLKASIEEFRKKEAAKNAAAQPEGPDMVNPSNPN